MNVCLLFALARESRPFLRQAPAVQPLAGAPFRAWTCNSSDRTLCIAETGVGGERCLQALRWLLEHGMTPRTTVIGAGFAGALTEGWRVGDVLLAHEVIDEQGRCWQTPFSCRDFATTSARAGRLLTVSRLIGDPVEKQGLSRRHQAEAVDMESATAAAFCAEHGLPFVAIRAISDDAVTALSPQLVRLLGGSRVSLRRLLGTVVRSPNVVPELCRLARATRRAAKQLGAFLSPLTTRMVEQ